MELNVFLFLSCQTSYALNKIGYERVFELYSLLFQCKFLDKRFHIMKKNKIPNNNEICTLRKSMKCVYRREIKEKKNIKDIAKSEEKNVYRY